VNSNRYSVLQRKLHWLVVLLVATQFILQSPMKHAMQTLAENQPLSFLDFLVTTTHTWGGVAVGGLMIYRLWLRVKRPVPVGAGQITGLLRIASEAMHWGFYVALLFMVLSGLLHYNFNLEMAANAHWVGKWLLIGMIGLHALAALLHHFLKKDDVLRQMIGNSRHTDTMSD